MLNGLLLMTNKKLMKAVPLRAPPRLLGLSDACIHSFLHYQRCNHEYKEPVSSIWSPTGWTCLEGLLKLVQELLLQLEPATLQLQLVTATLTGRIVAQLGLNVPPNVVKESPDRVISETSLLVQ